MKDLMLAHRWLLGLHNRSVSFLSLGRTCWERQIIKMDLIKRCQVNAEPQEVQISEKLIGNFQ